MTEHSNDVPLSSLSPDLDPDRWETLVSRINTAAEPYLDERQRLATPLSVVSSWRTPVLSGAVALAVAGVAALALIPEPEEVAVVEAVMPGTVAAWLDGGATFTMAELVADVEAYVP